MNKLVKIVILTLIGTGCFGTGLYYSTIRFNQTLDNIKSEYDVISEQVDAFVDLSNPKTIRFYTTELRRLLDDIKFLHVLIESGQIADEKLDEYLASKEGNVDGIMKRLDGITSEVDSMLTSSHDHMHLMVEELQDEVTSQLINSDVTSKVDSLNKQITSLENKLDDVNKVIDKIKNSKMSKYLK
jgi:chromosome segregation ATPase|tara:strand:+ start:1857 stop:2411 length:555 start_codon:yes stop_codon:yes gene_type:complete